jgi:hypothetical protein
MAIWECWDTFMRLTQDRSGARPRRCQLLCGAGWQPAGPIVNRPSLRRFPIGAQDTILDTIPPHKLQTDPLPNSSLCFAVRCQMASNSCVEGLVVDEPRGGLASARLIVPTTDLFVHCMFVQIAEDAPARFRLGIRQDAAA